MKQIYICPQNKELLKESKEGLIRTDGKLYPYLKGDKNILIPDFSTENEKSTEFINEYDSKESTVFYQNFLDWLFTTFNEKEYEFRIKVLKKLNLCKNYKVLITGCGLGADIQPIIDLFGSFGELYVCDLSAEMVIEASYKNQEIDNIFFSVCNAQNTPFKDDFFDGAFHFGGINMFDDIKSAIIEMNRVVKSGGKVVFGDEGIAPWLRDTEYGSIAINNNQLWNMEAPINMIPKNAIDVNLTWMLGNCFYIIDFVVSNTELFMNIDVPNKGVRGGTMRTRYYGKLEGVTEETKIKIINEAKSIGISVHDWLENICNKELLSRKEK